MADKSVFGLYQYGPLNIYNLYLSKGTICRKVKYISKLIYNVENTICLNINVFIVKIFLLINYLQITNIRINKFKIKNIII